MQRRDGGLRRVPEAHDQLEVGVDRGAPVLFGFALRAPGTVYHDSLRRIVRIDFVERAIDFGDHLRVDGVEFVRPIESEQDHRSLPFKLNGFEGHRFVLQIDLARLYGVFCELKILSSS